MFDVLCPHDSLNLRVKIKNMYRVVGLEKKITNMFADMWDSIYNWMVNINISDWFLFLSLVYKILIFDK